MRVSLLWFTHLYKQTASMETEGTVLYEMTSMETEVTVLVQHHTDDEDIEFPEFPTEVLDFDIKSKEVRGLSTEYIMQQTFPTQLYHSTFGTPHDFVKEKWGISERNSKGLHE